MQKAMKFVQKLTSMLTLKFRSFQVAYVWFCSFIYGFIKCNFVLYVVTFSIDIVFLHTDTFLTLISCFGICKLVVTCKLSTESKQVIIIIMVSGKLPRGKLSPGQGQGLVQDQRQNQGWGQFSSGAIFLEPIIIAMAIKMMPISALQEIGFSYKNNLKLSTVQKLLKKTNSIVFSTGKTI